MTIAARTTIQAPVERVFALFSDFKNLEKNVSAIEKVEFLEGSGEFQVGMKWRETRKMFGKEATEEMWISDIQPNRSYSVDAQSHGMKYHSTYTFAEKDGGTEVVLEFSGVPTTLGTKIMAPIFAVMMKRGIQKSLQVDMEELKKKLEG